MSTEAQITAWIASQQQAMIDLLRQTVDIDSGSYNKGGIDAVGAAIEGFLASQGIPTERLAQAKHGDCIRAMVGAEPAAGSAARGATEDSPTNAPTNIVLMGHRDTVFPDGEVNRRPFTIKDGIAYGPGVADMKAGLVMNAFVLAAFAKFGGAPAPLVGLFTGDEEIGSPEGRPVIEAEARRARVVFNSEPGRVSGKIQAIHALTDLERGITLNVGLVSGGQSVNTVAPWAEGQIDLRYIHPEDRDEIMGKIEAIIAKSFVPGTKAELTIKGEFLPLNQTPVAKRLFELYVQSAAETGFKTDGEFTGGCADSGFTAGVGAPTICAVGPVGGKAHSPDEFLLIDSLVPRAQAMARAILKLETVGL